MSKEDIKFKSNPYNYNNRLLTEIDVINIMKHLILMILNLIIFLFINFLLFTNHIVS